MRKQRDRETTDRRPGGAPQGARGAVPARPMARPVSRSSSARRSGPAAGRQDVRGSRGASRPALSARGRSLASEQRRPKTVRLAVLATVAVVLAITLVPALRTFLHQQGQIEAMRGTVARQRAAVTSLQQEQQRWNDPAYIEQQARQRLSFVRVGEKSYTVLDAPRAGTSGSSAALSTAAGPPAAWYTRLWASMAAPDPYVSSGAAGSAAK